MKTIPTDLAFPLVALGIAEEIGLSKREYFAGLAMQGMLATPLHKRETTGYGKKDDAVFIHECACDAVSVADALIAELNKEDEK